MLAAVGVKPQQFRAFMRSWRSQIAGMGISSEILEKMDGSRCDGSTGGHYSSLFEGRIKKGSPELSLGDPLHRLGYYGRQVEYASYLPAVM